MQAEAEAATSSGSAPSTASSSGAHAGPSSPRHSDRDARDVEKQAPPAPDDERAPLPGEAAGRSISKEEDPSQWRIVSWNTTADSAASKSGGSKDADPLADPDNPQGWSRAKKFSILLVTASCSLCVTCCSSIVASSYQNLERALGVSQEVAILGLSLFVIGLGLGPIFIAPLSEFFGRRPIYLISFGAFTLLGLPVAFANNIAVFLIFRFLTGFAGSAFLSVAGGTVTDLYAASELFLPMAIYSASPFAGPEIGPLYSGFSNYFTNSFRWAFWAMTIWAAVEWALIFLFLPETFAPMVLTRRARALRKETGDEQWRSEHECKNAGRSLKQTIATSAMRVPQLLALEPMLFLLCLWSALLLGIIYLLFEAYPIVFEEGHGFKLWQTGLTFLGIFVGMMCGLASMPFWNKLYLRARDKAGGSAPPEARLPPAMPGAFLTVIGLFIFAFTSYPHVHWIAPVIAGAPFGAGVVLIFISIFTFTGDAYRPVAASGMACNSVFRSSFAAGFPLFATQMYHRLGTVGATCLLAGLNVLMIPVPFLFYRYGASIRKRSRFTL